MMLSPLPLTFVTIVECGSLTGAADHLNLAKSAVSQNLKRLEQKLGVKLAVRTTRHLSLTPAGEHYYQRCKEILTLSERATVEMDSFGATPSGPFTLTAPHAFMASVITPAVATLTRRFPNLRPQILADDHRLDIVANRIDLSISVGPLPDSNLRARQIGTLQDLLSISPSLLATAPPQDAPEFITWVQSQPYIAHTREPAQVEYSLKPNRSLPAQTLTMNTVFRCNTLETIAGFTRDGMGIALLPNIGIAHDLKEKRLIPLPKVNMPPTAPIYAVHAYDALVPASVREATKYIQASIADAVS